MKRVGVAAIFLWVLVVFPLEGLTQEGQDSGSKQTVEISKNPADAPKIISVYGITPDDYLPNPESKPRYHKRPIRSQPRGAQLPESVLLVGGVVFVFILLGLVVSFIKEFEDEERESKMSGVSRSSDE